MPSRGHLSSVSIAVLALLAEGPRHAYGMQQLVRERGVDMVVNVRTRSGLHTALDRLTRDGLVRVHAVERDTRHPERTVYELTPAGRTALHDGLHDGLATPAREFPLFPAVVSFLYLLDPQDAREQLGHRAEALAERLDTTRAVLDASAEHHVPGVYLLEHEHVRAVLTAELAWVRGVCDEIDSGRLTWSPHA